MVRRSLVILCLSSLALLMGWGDAWSQTVRAYVDRNPISVEETVRLVVEQQGQTTGDSPNLSPLEKDFDLLGNAQSSQTSIINGRTSTSKQWVITLAPKHAGNVTIPPITVGGQSSDPLVLTVQAATQGAKGTTGKDFFLEATVEPKDPYVQSQILYVLRLYHAVPLREGQIEDPQISQAVVERIGEDQSFETIRDGRRYQVIERRYLVVPQASGSLKIPSVLFSGKVPDGRRSRSMLDEMFGNRGGVLGGGFQSARLVRTRSPELTLTVREIPPGMRGKAWLPARELSLTETWSTDSLEVEVGEPITRTITIHAKGITGEQLPELPFSENAQVKIYPDQPNITTTFDGSWAVGTREQKLALVPPPPGDLSIPEIRLRWWNLDTHQPEEAVLPARLLTILGSPGAFKDKEKNMVMRDRPEPSKSAAEQALSSANTGQTLPSFLLTQWPLMAGLFLVMWVLTLAGWWYDRRRVRTNLTVRKTQEVEQARASLRAVRESVKKACLENSPGHTREALLKWATVACHGNPERSLGNIAQKFSHPGQGQSEAQLAILDLDRTLYAAEQNAWDGKKFWNVVSPEMSHLESSKSAHRVKGHTALPDLYLHA